MHDFLCLVDLDDESYEHVDGVLSSYSALPGLLIDGKRKESNERYSTKLK